MGSIQDYERLGFFIINKCFSDRYFAHYGIKGQKWGVRRFQNYDGTLTEEGKRRYAKLKEKTGIDLQFFADTSDKKSKKVKWDSYEIAGPEKEGGIFHLTEGSHIKNKHCFAGKDGDDPLDEQTALGLSEQIGGKPENWQHWKGDGVVDYYGEDRKADIHWFEEESVGRHKFKVKEWQD